MTIDERRKYLRKMKSRWPAAGRANQPLSQQPSQLRAGTDILDIFLISWYNQVNTSLNLIAIACC
jgi:hypothetical protein